MPMHTPAMAAQLSALAPAAAGQPHVVPEASSCYVFDARPSPDGAGILLFGLAFLGGNPAKRGAYGPVTVHVRNIDRTLWLRIDGTEEVSAEEGLDEEFECQVIDAAENVLKGVFGAKVASTSTLSIEFRSYSFETDAPRGTAAWVRCDLPEHAVTDTVASLTRARQHICRNTPFTHALGLTITPLELLVSERHLAGPSWIFVTTDPLTGKSPSIHPPRGQSGFIWECPSPGCIVNPHVQPESPPLSALFVNVTTSTATVGTTGTTELDSWSTIYYPNFDTRAATLRDVDPRGDIVAHTVQVQYYPTMLRKEKQRLDAARKAGKPEPEAEQAMKEALATALSTLRSVGDANLPCSLVPCGVDELPNSANVTVIKPGGDSKALAAGLLDRVRQHNPDIIMGYGLADWARPVVKALGGQSLVAFSRWPQTPPADTPQPVRAMQNLFFGRLAIDLEGTANEFMFHRSSFSLHDTIRDELGVIAPRPAPPAPGSLLGCWESPAGLREYMQGEVNTARCAALLALHLNAVPLTRQICNITYTAWHEGVIAQRAQRAEHKLMHAILSTGGLCPDLYPQSSTGHGRQKGKYEGGYNLDPATGLHIRPTALLDYASLYPNIIREYNLSFETINVEDAEAAVEASARPMELLRGEGRPGGSVAGLIPNVLTEYLDARERIRGAMKHENDEMERKRLNVQQLAVKIVANSMYGYLGYDRARFRAVHLAALVTRLGRDIIKFTQDVVGKDRVIYGDTDSVMVRLDKAGNVLSAVPAEAAEAVAACAREAKDLANLVCRDFKYLRMTLDGIYSRMIILSKKRYAAQQVTDDSIDLAVKGDRATLPQITPLYKGLDLVRREYCSVAKESNRALIAALFTSADAYVSGDTAVVSAAISSALGPIVDRMRNSECSLYDYVIRTQLTRELREYDANAGTGNSLPHVAVARRAVERGETVRSGMVIEYVVTDKNVAGTSDTGRADCSEMVTKCVVDGLKPAIDYYIRDQLWPTCERLAGAIGDDVCGMVAHVLGVDHRPRAPQPEPGRTGTNVVVDSTLADRLPLLEHCPICRRNFAWPASDPANPRRLGEYGCSLLQGDLLGPVTHAECAHRLIPTNVTSAAQRACRALMQLHRRNLFSCHNPACPGARVTGELEEMEPLGSLYTANVTQSPIYDQAQFGSLTIDDRPGCGCQFCRGPIDEWTTDAVVGIQQAAWRRIMRRSVAPDQTVQARAARGDKEAAALALSIQASGKGDVNEGDCGKEFEVLDTPATVCNMDVLIKRLVGACTLEYD